jgi:urate oxidase
MPIELAENRYGKSSVRLLKVLRHADRHEIFEVTVDIACTGDLAAAYTEGDNRGVLPTDTLKNTVYALARERSFKEMEDFGLLLGRHFLSENPQLHQVEVALTARPWSRIEVAGEPHPHAFVESGAARRRARVEVGREGIAVRAGIVDLLVLKTAGSAFQGFPRDRFTTLPEARDRVLATRIDADWSYDGVDLDFGTAFLGIERRLVEAFATHDSRSLQHTLYAMGEAVLAGFPEVLEIHLRLPNQHYLLANLSPFGLDNDNEIFVATDEPYGLIEGTLRRRRRAP